MRPLRLAALPGSLRLVTGLFACVMLLFLLLAQANLWLQVGGGSLPSAEQVLWKYHGKPGASRLHKVLDLSLSEKDPHNMSQFAGGSTPEERAAIVQRLLAWVDAGAPRSAADAPTPPPDPLVLWDDVAPVFTGHETCGQCHAAGGVKADLPLDTYERVRAQAAPDRGLPWGTLMISAHNHLFAFAVAALLLGTLLCFTGLRGLPRLALIGMAFAGPVLDVAGWLLTKTCGAPFHLLVLAGGGMFGAAVGGMALVVAWESFLARPGAAGSAEQP